MSIYRRGQVLWIKLRDARGRLLRRSAHTSDRDQALALESQMRLQFGKRVLISDISTSRKITFSELGKRCMASWCASLEPTTLVTYTKILRKLEEYFGSLQISSINAEMITDFRNTTAGSVGPATVNRRLAVISRMFSMAKADKLVTFNPVDKKAHFLKEPPPREVLLELEDQSKFLSFFKDGQLLHVLMRLATGMRTGEIDRLLVRDLDFTQGLIAVLKTKNNRTRRVPMASLLREPLQAWCRGKERTARIFEGVPSYYRWRWNRAKKAIGVPDLRPHDLRHTFATNFRRAGGKLEILSRTLGHGTLQMTMRYRYVGDSEIQEEMKLMDRYLERGLCPGGTAQKKAA